MSKLMGIKERRAEAEGLVRRARGAGTQDLPPRVLAADGCAFLLADLDLQVSIFNRPVATLPLSLPELRGKLQARGAPPPYRTESLAEAYTYPLLVAAPQGPVEEGHLAFGADGAVFCCDEARRSDWPSIVEALVRALEATPPADFEDRVFDPEAGAWVYYGVRGGEPFEDVVEGEDPPDWAD